MIDTTKIILAGEGGQGIQTIAKVITEVAAEQGLDVSYIPVFGVEQRGTPSVAFIILSHEKIYYPRFDSADYAIILQKRAVASVLAYINKKTKVVFDSSTVSVRDLPDEAIHSFGIPATQIATEKFTPKAFNLIVAGKLSRVLNLDEDQVWQKIEKLLGKKFKTPEIKEKSRQAYLSGRKYIFELKDFSRPTFQPATGKIIIKNAEKTAQILPERCKGCGICIVKCPVGALKFSDTLGVFATPVPEIDLEKCIACGNCFRFCPDGAIAVEKNKKLK
ncbi:hypothetical protein COT78_02695 [Candidatus Berkelbacteria bacterium CG10_big_fil_rev_8_21_14_0_10_43_13]|uniref:4Fe-4S ferredoxin-type domain-containing protein n=1 Tax=Candidatus Berkelbacteria bacterium CG10_big_fil_rev_8_21_14_0_10_43_13 TaxID=1974514 RepID=A0A2H0W682_9BACT|nr:MAG: hypothetical protein COT78_02695 [Candidatus Berkelbacteria bacterium CG10_big_fil_rev_8_21_14_0_10_43_13]